MQAGLERTSGANYGRWVSSRNWVRAALARLFVDEPGGRMLYSTGSTHLLSAILTRVTGRSTLDAGARLAGRRLKGFSIAAWERDPQGIYLGGNQMAMSARSLLAFGELYRNGGKTPEGRSVVPPEWIELSWQHRTHSRFTGDGYGYGWFLRTIGGREVRYAWGYGGQMLYIVPVARPHRRHDLRRRRAVRPHRLSRQPAPADDRYHPCKRNRDCEPSRLMAIV